MRKTLIFIVGIALCRCVVPQDTYVWGLFPTFNPSGSLTKKLDYNVYSFLAIYPVEQTSNEVIYPAKINVFYIELDVIYNITKEWSLAGSYTYEKVNPFRDDYRNEHRLWLQMQQYYGFEKFNLKSRLRYDIRFIQNRATAETDFKPRLRYLLGIDFSLNNKSHYFAAYNEFFFDTYAERIATYTENWAFAGVGFTFSERVKLETGPLVISWVRNIEKNWLHQFFWQVTLMTRWD